MRKNLSTIIEELGQHHMLTYHPQSQDREARTKNGQIRAPKTAKYVHQNSPNACAKISYKRATKKNKYEHQNEIRV